MKLEKQIADFIQMRIEGKSFDEISKELNTSKSTLIEWNKKVEVRTEITEGKALALNTIVRAFAYDRQTRLEALLKLSKKINDELSNRDLSEVSTDTLLKMSIANDGRISALFNNTFEFGNPDSTPDNPAKLITGMEVV